MTTQDIEEMSIDEDIVYDVWSAYDRGDEPHEIADDFGISPEEAEYHLVIVAMAHDAYNDEIGEYFLDITRPDWREDLSWS